VIYLGLGSNLGDRRAHLDAAVAQLKLIGRVERVSPYVETAALLPPEDDRPQPAYLNGAVAFEADLEPSALLHALREVERSQGRPPERARWQPRTLDLDVLLWGDRVIDAPELRVPHPQLHLRLFVLEPLAVIAPDAVHPLLKLTVRELFNHYNRSHAGLAVEALPVA
jgi:2-amino-4-hydroxy-6-hydroxymethyldihydropteridine diphosphokinase